MSERLIILALFAVGVVLAYQLYKRWQIRRAASLAPRDPLLAELRAGLPTILYFTSPTCAPCKTRQRPALARLYEELGDAFQVVEVDAMADPAAATRWGVMSIPTMFVLDADGRPRQVNHGVAGVEKLRSQLKGIASARRANRTDRAA